MVTPHINKRNLEKAKEEIKLFRKLFHVFNFYEPNPVKCLNIFFVYAARIL